MIRFALLGAGRIGRIHAGNILAHPKARLAAVYDPDPAVGELVSTWGASFRDLDGALGDPDIDAVVIATPAETHAELVERAASAGKAIFCEKPIDRDLARTEACVAAVRHAGVQLFLAFNRRFDPSFAALRRRVAAGEIGRVELAFLTSRDPAPPSLAYIRRSGGLFRDMMIHDFDVARWLTGDAFTRVHAVGASFADPAIGELGYLDTAVVTLVAASGAIVTINCAMRAAYGYDQRVELHGEHGMLQLGNRFETSIVRAGADGIARELPLAFFAERYASAYVAELDHFIDALANGGVLRPDGEDGLAALRLAEAAHRSWETGVPVDIGFVR